MRAIFGVLGFLIVLAVVGILVKKQLASTRQAIPALAVTVPGAASTANKPAVTVQEQSQQSQQQYKLSVESAMQQARPMPDEKP